MTALRRAGAHRTHRSILYTPARGRRKNVRAFSHLLSHARLGRRRRASASPSRLYDRASRGAPRLSPSVAACRARARRAGRPGPGGRPPSVTDTCLRSVFHDRVDNVHAHTRAYDAHAIQLTPHKGLTPSPIHGKNSGTGEHRPRFPAVMRITTQRRGSSGQARWHHGESACCPCHRAAKTRLLPPPASRATAVESRAGSP